jgi:hypothetical protein
MTNINVLFVVWRYRHLDSETESGTSGYPGYLLDHTDYWFDEHRFSGAVRGTYNWPGGGIVSTCGRNVTNLPMVFSLTMSL